MRLDDVFLKIVSLFIFGVFFDYMIFVELLGFNEYDNIKKEEEGNKVNVGELDFKFFVWYNKYFYFMYG